MRAIQLMLLLTAPCWSCEACGNWKMNTARSTVIGNRKRVTVRIEPHQTGEVFTFETVAGDGRAFTSSTILYFDGKARDFQDHDCSGTESSRRVDSQTVEILRSCASGEWSRVVRRLGTQSKDLILDITEQHPDGRRFERRLVLEKK